MRSRGYAPEIVHAHDWQAAMTLAYMRYGQAAAVPTVMTVHNLAFQGKFPADDFPHCLACRRKPWRSTASNIMAASASSRRGCRRRSAITTVSPNYGQEIRTPDFGMGLDGLLEPACDDLHGIVNGIDTDIWNPAYRPASVQKPIRRDRSRGARPTSAPWRSASDSIMTTVRSCASSAD